MKLQDRYQQGEEVAVWLEIQSMDEAALKSNMGDVVAVVKETMNRVRYNVDKIYEGLQLEGYLFESDKPRKLPDDGTADRVEELKQVVREFGQLPLSLEYFWKVVGAVDFRPAWKRPIRFEMADPLYVEQVELELAYVSNEDEGWAETMSEQLEEGEPAYIEFAPDVYHKDNISGGIAYGVALTEQLQADALVVNTKYGALFFVDYLRRCFAFGGFPNIEQGNRDYLPFIEKLRSGLKPI